MNDPRTLTARFDSMYSSLNARGTRPDYFWRRGYDMSYFETPTAFGTAPAEVRVSVGASVESWKGFEVQYDSVRDDASVDTSYWIAAYKGNDLDRFFVAYYSFGVLTTVFFDSDTTESRVAGLYSFQTTKSASAGTCTVPAQVVNPIVNSIAASPCVPASFTTSFIVAMPAGSEGLDSTTISIENVTLPGVELTRGDTTTH